MRQPASLAGRQVQPVQNEDSRSRNLSISGNSQSVVCRAVERRDGAEVNGTEFPGPTASRDQTIEPDKMFMN